MQEENRVLVVDDEADLAFLYSMYLKQRDFKSTEAGDLETALSKVDPDLSGIILDYNVPPKPGDDPTTNTEAVMEKALRVGYKGWFLLNSGLEYDRMEQLASHLTDHGFPVRVIHKPFQPEEATNAIEALKGLTYQEPAVLPSKPAYELPAKPGK